MLYDDSGQVAWMQPSHPDPSAGAVESYLHDRLVNDGQDGKSKESSVRLFPYRVGERQSALQAHRFPLGSSGQVLEVILDVTESTRCVEQAVERRVVDGVARKLGHEINNPLASIFGAVEMLLLGDPAAAERQQLQVVMEQADRISAVVHGLRSTDDTIEEIGALTARLPDRATPICSS